MPTYEYRCTACGHEFEIVQKFSDDALEHCPQCEGRLRKVFNAVGVVFKGSGFYHTDSRDAAAKGKGGSGAEGSGGGSGGSDTGSDSKTAAKSESTPAAKTETKTEKSTPKAESKPSSGS